MQKSPLLLLGIIFLFTVHTAFAGWVVIEESTDNFGNHQFQTTFISKNMVRIDRTTTINILDLDKQKLTLIFPQHRLYWHGTPQELTSKTNELIKRQLQEMLVHTHVSRQSAIRKMITELDNPSKNLDSTNLSFKVQINNTGKSAQINGFKTYEYKVLVDSILKETLWVTSDQSPYNEIDIKKMLLFTRSLRPASMESIITGSPAYIALLQHGMIIKSVEVHANGMRQTSVVKRMKQMAIDADIFMPPPGYREAGIEEIMQMDLGTKLPGAGTPPKDDKDGLPQIPKL